MQAVADRLGFEEVLAEVDIIVVAKLAQNRPSGLVAPPLDEQRVQEDKTCTTGSQSQDWPG